MPSSCCTALSATRSLVWWAMVSCSVRSEGCSQHATNCCSALSGRVGGCIIHSENSKPNCNYCTFHQFPGIKKEICFIKYNTHLKLAKPHDTWQNSPYKAHTKHYNWKKIPVVQKSGKMHPVSESSDLLLVSGYISLCDDMMQVIWIFQWILIVWWRSSEWGWMMLSNQFSQTPPSY